MSTYFSRDVLLQSSIFELRNIARDIGVCSPTIYKKEDLIEKIFEIVNGEVKPHVPKSKQGRPPKSLSNTSRKSVFDMILPTEENTYQIEEGKMPCLSESIKAFLEDEKAIVQRNFEVDGYLDVTPYGYGFLRNAKEVYTSFGGAYISQKMIADHKLKHGDYIKGIAKVLEEGKPYVLYEIHEINLGKELREGEFERLPVTYSLSRLDFGDIDNFLVGAPNLIIQPKENKMLAHDYFKDIDNHFKLMLVKLEANKEQELALKQVDIESFYTTMLQKPSENIGVINLALAVAKRRASDGENIILYIDSIDMAIKNQNVLAGNNMLDLKANTLDNIKELSMSARQLAKVGSLTIVGLYNYSEGSSFDKDMISVMQDYFSKTYETKK